MQKADSLPWLIAQNGHKSKYHSELKFIYKTSWRYTRRRYFCSGFLHRTNLYVRKNKAFECFECYCWIHWHAQFFFHLVVAQLIWSPFPCQPPELMLSEAHCQLSQCGVRLHISWVNTERWIFVNIIAFQVESVDKESVSLCIDSVYRKLTRLVLSSITISGTFKGTKFRKK